MSWVQEQWKIGMVWVWFHSHKMENKDPMRNYYTVGQQQKHIQRLCYHLVQGLVVVKLFSIKNYTNRQRVTGILR